MDFPNTQSKAQYQNWEGQAEVKGYNKHEKYGMSYLFDCEGKDVWASCGKKEFNLTKGGIYEIKLSNKVGTKTWYINEAKSITSATPPVEDKRADQLIKEVKTGTKPTIEQKKADGQAQGNYRTLAANFITEYFKLTQQIPQQDVILAFNNILKIAENNYFNSDEVSEVTPKSVDPYTQVAKELNL